jgi:hypothetical protein
VEGRKWCVRCRKMRGEDGSVTMCRLCVDQMKERQRVRVDARRWNEQCIRCGVSVADSRRYYCPTCRANAVERQNKHKASVTLGV